MDAGKEAKKTAEVGPLHCLNPECRGLLAYEVDGDNVLTADLAWMAEKSGNVRYFPCPKCGGHNEIEAFGASNGRTRHRVVRYTRPG